MSEYPYRAIATLKYRPPPAQGPSISFDKGAIVTVLAAADDDGDWLEGENEHGAKGVFPSTFVKRLAADADAEQGVGAPSSSSRASAAAPESTRDEEPRSEAPTPVSIEQAAASISHPTTSTTPAKATPPPPAKKPNALAARIAAFNQSQQAPAAPAPVPRAKPASKWTVGAAPAPPASSPPPRSAPLPAAGPPESIAATERDEEKTDSSGGKPKEFSAQDAQESIGRGGGSLKDRIKALQGLQMDQPAPPGRPPKPWKKKAVEEEQQAPADSPAAESSTRDGDAVGNDKELKHDVEMPSAGDEQPPDVPSFEPAEPVEARDDAPDGSAKQPGEDEETVESPAQALEKEPTGARSEKPSSIDLLAIAADSTPVVMTPGSASLEVPSDPSPFIPSSDTPPVSAAKPEQAVEGEEDSEAAKKQAIAARMAGLGGHKIGASVPIAALPRKAAGPRRNPRGGTAARAAAAAATAPAESQGEARGDVEIEQTGIGEKNQEPEHVAEEEAPLEQPGSKEAETAIVEPDHDEQAKTGDVLASMGGAFSLLRADNDDDDADEQGDDAVADDDDFDTPAPPPPPPPPTRPAETETEIEDPALARGETQVEEAEFAQREDSGAKPANIAQEAVETLPTPATSDPAVDDDDAKEETRCSPPTVPLNRPPVPPAFVRQVTDEPPKAEVASHRFTAEIDNPREGSSASNPAPPARPTHAPPLATGHETVSDEPRPSARGPDEVSPTPADSQRRSPVVIPADVAGFRLPQDGEAQKPPVPRHPPPPGHEKVTTDAEDRIMNETEVVTPPQEAFDESTAAPELTAPSVLDLAEVRDSHPESEDLSQQALPRPGRTEGEATPAVSPRTTSPQRPGNDEDDEGEEDEEEDPEVARRRAIAARMAKLGGMSMRMGPMIPPIGGLPPPAAKKKAKQPKAAEENEPEKTVDVEDLNEQVVESQSSGNVTPDHPARRYGGIPSGGFALPGIAALRPVKQEVPEDERPDASRAETAQTEGETQADAEEEEEEEEQRDEEEREPTSPPPRPAGRPLTMPPRRSVPIPDPVPTEGGTEREEERDVPEQFVAEPEHEEEAAAEMPPPPPPARPAGGHQESVPPPAGMSTAPSSPPTRSVPPPSKRESTFSLGRTTTRSSHRSSTAPGATSAASMGFASPRQSLDLAFDAERVQGGGGGGLAQGQYLAKDIDLDTQAGNAWWRAPNGLPRSLQGRNDVAVESSAGAPGNKELEVIYSDYSRTLVSVAFDPADTTEATTSVAQNHFAPPGKPSLDVLLHYSASLGAQVFAAAHLKANDKSAARGGAGLTDKAFVEFCFGRATEPVPPIGSTFGAKVYEASISPEGKKGPAFAMDDEPRGGDVVVFREVKLKQTLGSKTVGSHVAIVSGFDDKKSKLRVLEVDKNGSSIDEGAYKLDDLKQGTITVYRVLGRDFL